MPYIGVPGSNFIGLQLKVNNFYGNNKSSFALSRARELSDKMFCSFNEIAKIMYSIKKILVYMVKES